MNSELKKKITKIMFVTIVGMLITIYWFRYYGVMIDNNITFVVEVGVGIIITIIVLIISQKNELKIEKATNDILDRIKKEQDGKIKDQRYAKDLFLQEFYLIMKSIKSIHATTKSRNEDTNLVLNDSQYITIMPHVNDIKDHGRKLDEIIEDSHNYFGMLDRGMLKTISSQCQNEPNFENGKKYHDFYESLKKMITSKIEEYKQSKEKIETSESVPYDLEKNQKLETGSKSKSLDSEKKPVMDGSITVSSDRTIYPLDSIIHVRAQLDYVIKNENIIYEIFNSKGELLLSRTLDPLTCDGSKLTIDNIFQADFKMNGDKWMIGNQYTVRGTYGISYAEDSFTIDQRTPVIQTDKTVYSIHSNLILTVIDPDADKDNQIPEFVGDRNDSKLTIECPYGKIDGYRLKETGNSTGIFQGIIRILGISKDGNVIKWNRDGKIIDKIQGTGIDDGFIGGKRDDIITITYENGNRVVATSFFVSNYDAIVEMDKIVYRPNDKVRITVVASNFSFNFDSKNEIDQESKNMIRIRTSIDELSNYKLVETGIDTGVFTGELQLVDSLEKSSNRYQSKFGPNDGCIACKNKDIIEIIFVPFKNKLIIGDASIKP